MGRALRYIYFRLSRDLAARRRSGPDFSRFLAIVLMTIVNGDYLGACLKGFELIVHGDFLAPWSTLWAITLPTGVFAAQFVCLATRERDRIIYAEFSAKPIGRTKGGLLVLAWFIGGVGSASLMIGIFG